MALNLPSAIAPVIVLIIAFILAWIIISIPIYLAAKVISRRHTTFGKAMLAAVIAPIVTLVFFFIVSLGLSIFLGPFAILVAIFVAIIVLSYVYASIFDTGLLGGFAIALLGTIITYVVSLGIALVFGIALFFTPPGFGFQGGTTSII